MLGFGPLASFPLADDGATSGIAASVGAASGVGAASAVGFSAARVAPASDISVGAWTSSLGGALYAAVDEVVPDDSDYISTTSLSVAQVKLAPANDPGVDTNFRVLYRAASASGTQTLIVRLKQAATLIASETRTNVPTTETAYALAVTSGEAANITDFSDLRVEVEYA